MKSGSGRPPERYGPIRRFFCPHFFSIVGEEYLHTVTPIFKQTYETWMKDSRLSRDKADIGESVEGKSYDVYALFQKCVRCGKEITTESKDISPDPERRKRGKSGRGQSKDHQETGKEEQGRANPVPHVSGDLKTKPEKGSEGDGGGG